MEPINNVLSKIPTPTVSPPLASMTMTEVCPDCAGTDFVRLDYPVGHPKFGKIERCPNPIHQPERINRLASISGLLPDEISRCLSDIKRIKGNETMLDAAAGLLESPYGWLWIWGGPGNAKSEVLIALVNELNQAQRGPAVYAKLTTLINYMRDAFAERKKRDNDQDYDLGYVKRFERLRDIPVLAIDEMDKAFRETDLMKEFRFDFLDERYRQGLTGQTITIFASNENPATLPDALYDRVRDGRFKVVHNTAGSARRDMKRT